jgi:hypothetical protein
MAKLYGILAILGWAFVPVFFAFVWWRIRMKTKQNRGFTVVQDNEK